MARTPKPWFWKARKAWYVTIDGTRHFLGDEKDAAETRFHELMAAPQKRIVRSDSLAVIIDLFLDWCLKHRAPDTYEWYRYRLERFAQRYPDLRTHQLRPFHVQQWLDSMTELSSGSHRNYCRSIKRAVRWAKRQGYIDVNPIADLEEPRCGKRETVISQAEFDRILTLVPCEEFRDLLIVTWETGCRPQESLRVETRHVELKNNRWVFPESEGKGKIGRVVYLTEKAADITRRYRVRYPGGKLFRSSSGKPWTTSSANCGFIRLQQKLGLAELIAREEEASEEQIRTYSEKLCPTRVARMGRSSRRNDVVSSDWPVCHLLLLAMPAFLQLHLAAPDPAVGHVKRFLGEPIDDDAGDAGRRADVRRRQNSVPSRPRVRHPAGDRGRITGRERSCRRTPWCERIRRNSSSVRSSAQRTLVPTKIRKRAVPPARL